MPKSLKSDIINRAYSLIKIHGITSSASTEDIDLALDRLENMAAEFKGRNICTGYNFQDEPDTTDESGLERKYWNAYSVQLACRTLMDFGKQLTPELAAMQRGTLAFLHADTAVVNRTEYPARQPIGSGTTLRYNRFDRYYRPSEQAPNSCATNTMYKTNVDNFVEHFDAYLDASETISSFTIEADTGLTINSSSISGSDILYQILATGTSSTADTVLQVKIVITTSASRIETRLINFVIITPDDIE